MNAADLLLIAFLLVAAFAAVWVAWSAGKASSARMYQAELATARAAALRYRADRDREAEYARMLRLSPQHPTLRAVPPRDRDA